MWAEGDHIYAISRKYLGVDLGRPLFLADYMAHGIKTPNWLTFVGDDFLEMMGGKDTMIGKLPESVEPLDLEHGLLLKAGPQPLFGEVNRKEDLADYRAVAEACRAVAIPDESWVSMTASVVLRTRNGGSTALTDNA